MGCVGDDCLGIGVMIFVNDIGDKFVFVVEIDDWMGYCNVIGLIWMEDYYVCLVILFRDSFIVYFIVFLIEVMWIWKLKNDCFFCIVFIDEDV